MQPEVQRLNSPSRRRVLALIAVWLGAAAVFGSLQARRETNLEAQLTVGVFSGGFWGLFMMAFMIPWGLSTRYEVTLGPGMLIVRSWWAALRGRSGSNEWVEPRDSWLRRDTFGKCWLEPQGICFGSLRRNVDVAFERLGFEIRDEQADWEIANPEKHLAWKVLLGCAFASWVAALGATVATEDMGPCFGFIVAGFAFMIAASVVRHGRDWVRG